MSFVVEEWHDRRENSGILGHRHQTVIRWRGTDYSALRSVRLLLQRLTVSFFLSPELYAGMIATKYDLNGTVAWRRHRCDWPDDGKRSWVAKLEFKKKGGRVMACAGGMFGIEERETKKSSEPLKITRLLGAHPKLTTLTLPPLLCTIPSPCPSSKPSPDFLLLPTPTRSHPELNRAKSSIPTSPSPPRPPCLPMKRFSPPFLLQVLHRSSMC